MHSLERVIIHFDYDAFYASVFEAKNPALKNVPFAVQQKQIIVTVNYKGRERGLHKLQLVKEARRVCPEVVIELGEDLSIFRDASVELFRFIRSFSWSDRAERLGFDEVWLDVTDMVEHNLDLLNRNDLRHSFFQLSRDDPTRGFAYDATSVAGHTYPEDYAAPADADDLTLRLRIGSHLALHIRHGLENTQGYTCTVGVATNKLLSKLVGTLHKPKSQTTIMPPLITRDGRPSNVTTFLDSHDIGKIPGIGFKISQKLRDHYLQRPAAIDEGLVYGGTKDIVTIAAFRAQPNINAVTLEKLLVGPGFAHGIGHKVWSLIHGDDDTEVSPARNVPSQISIEDSYLRLDTMPELVQEFDRLGRSLLGRMRVDLLADDDDVEPADTANARDMPKPMVTKKWLARPRTLRLTTRPRMPLQPDGTRIRSFKRISHSAPMPNFVFNLSDSIDQLSEKLVREHILPMFRKLHAEKSGWNLSLVNLAATNMAETAGNSKTANGRDIKGMFMRQDEVLKDFRLSEETDDRGESSSVSDAGPLDTTRPAILSQPENTSTFPEDYEDSSSWDEEETEGTELCCCGECGIRLPSFAMSAHSRFHSHLREPQ